MSESKHPTGYHAAKRSWVQRHGPDYEFLPRVAAMLERTMTNDDLIEKLGKSQQQVMSLTVQNRALKKRAEILEGLVMDVVIDLRGNVLKSVIQERITKVMQKLDGEGQ